MGRQFPAKEAKKANIMKEVLSRQSSIMTSEKARKAWFLYMTHRV